MESVAEVKPTGDAPFFRAPERAEKAPSARQSFFSEPSQEPERAFFKGPLPSVPQAEAKEKIRNTQRNLSVLIPHTRNQNPENGMGFW